MVRNVGTMRTAENNDMEYVLQRLDVDENGHAPGAGPIGLDLENGRSVPHTVLAFHAVLGAFYNEAIDLGDFEQDDLRILLTSAMGVTDAAEYLQCTQVLTKPIEATLLATGQILQQSIANEPLAWLEFAHRIRSRAIFREALIHAAGRSDNAELKERLRGVPSPLAAVVVEKGKIIQDGIQLGVMKMLTYYPTHLHREKTVGRADRDSIGRASYGNDIMSWIGLVWLRHWLAHHVGYDNTHNAEDLGFAFAQDILKGGDAYLSKAELEDFRKIFPMSSKGDAVIETKLDELKHHLKSFVQPFSKNEAQLDIRQYPVQHFTCTKVDLKDYPWDLGTTSRASQANESVVEEGDESDDGDDDESMDGLVYRG